MRFNKFSNGERASHSFLARCSIGVGLFALLLAGACSLGTGVTPICNIDNTEPACDPLPKCDDGKGGLLGTEECCLLRANDNYNLVCMTENASGKDYRTLCGVNGPGLAACCTAALTTFNNCIKK